LVDSARANPIGWSRILIVRDWRWTAGHRRPHCGRWLCTGPALRPQPIATFGSIRRRIDAVCSRQELCAPHSMAMTSWSSTNRY